MRLELDVKELEFMKFFRGIERDRRPVNQAADRNEHAVEIERVASRHEQVNVRRPKSKR